MSVTMAPFIVIVKKMVKYALGMNCGHLESSIQVLAIC